MGNICRLLWFGLFGLFRSRASLEAEVLALRHQLTVLQRKVPMRPAFRNVDRLIFSLLYRVAPSTLNALTIVKPETVIRWHRAGFRAWWHWKSRPRGGRPQMSIEIRRLIRTISLANPLGAHRAFMANCSSLASMSARRALQNRWPGGGDPRRRVGRPFCAIMPTALRRWICLSFRRCHYGFCMGC